MPRFITPPTAAKLRTRFVDRFEKNTASAYSGDLNAFARFMAEESVDVALSDLLKMDGKTANETVERYKLSIAGAKLLTFRRRISTLRSFCQFAHADGVISWTLAVNSNVKRTEKQKIAATPKDMSGPPERKILALLRSLAASGTPDAIRDIAIIDLHYYRGLRVSELVGLDVSHVNFKTLRVRIVGKGRAVSEELDILKSTANSIKKWLAVRPGPKDGPLFVRLDPAAKKPSDYTRISRTGLFLKFRQYGKKLGCPFRPHGLRHSSVTSLIERSLRAKLPLTSVQHFARHKSFATTAGYVNKSGAEVRKAMALFPR